MCRAGQLSIKPPSITTSPVLLLTEHHGQVSSRAEGQVAVLRSLSECTVEASSQPCIGKGSFNFLRALSSCTMPDEAKGVHIIGSGSSIPRLMPSPQKGPYVESTTDVREVLAYSTGIFRDGLANAPVVIPIQTESK